MAITGIFEKANYKYKKSDFSKTTNQEKGFSVNEKAETEEKPFTTKQVSQMSAMDIFEKMNSCGRNAVKMKKNDLLQTDSESDEKTKKADEEEPKNKTDIIVRPDGSRVLVVTMNIGGTQTSMSLKISDATDMQNETRDPEMGEEEVTTTMNDMENKSELENASGLDSVSSMENVESK